MNDINFDNGVLTVHISGEIDHNAATGMRIRIDGQAQRFKPQILQLDFSEVKFMDSSGIGLIMGRYRQMQLLGGKLRVVNIPDNLKKVFRLSGLDRLGVLEEVKK